MERWLTFDCFGTLVSWQRGFPKILKRVARERNEELAAAYHRYEREIEAQTYRSYKDVLRTTLRRAAESIDLPLTGPEYGVLAEHWDEQPVWEDVGTAMQSVKRAGWKVAALTNCDNDLFERTKRTLPFAFDAIITAQDVSSYKPGHAHFLKFEELGIPRDHWVHAACSYFHDIVPARDLRIRSIWIDRDNTGEDPGAAWHVQPDLNGLAESADLVASVKRPPRSG